MKVIIGLETHVQLATKSKLFCACSTSNAEPNENTCPICLGFPGSKPTINKKAIDFAVMLSRALNCKINNESFFSRKSYFYPDLAKDFQITQYEVPIGIDGYLDIVSDTGEKKRIRIRRVHLEEDPASLIHPSGSLETSKYVLMDYNRSGIPLCEVVTEPDFSSPAEARQYLNKLATILSYLGIFDESESSMRSDANISLEGSERIEIKNISGFKLAEKALNYEVARQKTIVNAGRKIRRETRHFDPVSGITTTLRVKETEEDYGYIFEPDLASLQMEESFVSEIESKIPELPDKRALRFISQYKLNQNTVDTLVSDKFMADFFEKCAEKYTNYSNLAKWMVVDLLKCLNWNKISLKQSKISPKSFLEFISLMDEGKITERAGKELIKKWVEKGGDVIQLSKELAQMTDESLINNAVSKVIADNPKVVSDYKSGNQKSLEFLVGLALKATGMRADPKVIREELLKQM